MLLVPGRTMRHIYTFLLCSLFAVLAINTPAQTSSPPEQTQNPASMEGTIVSVSRETMVVRTDDRQFHLFVFDSDFIRPRGLLPGSRIRVVSNPTDETGLRVATRVTVLTQ